jgi:hypothetical protein
MERKLGRKVLHENTRVMFNSNNDTQYLLYV